MTAVNVAFQGTRLVDPSAPAVSLQLFKAARAEQDVVPGSVRMYAGGRLRIITTPGTNRQSSLTFVRCTESNVATLRAWRGRLLLLRDGQGWRRWGTYFDVQPASVVSSVGAPYTVQITWLDSTYIEGV